MMSDIDPQLSWLERYTDNVEVGSSNLPGSTRLTRGMISQQECYLRDRKVQRYGELAQLARAPALQAGGHRFESVILHIWRHIYVDRPSDHRHIGKYIDIETIVKRQRGFWRWYESTIEGLFEIEMRSHCVKQILSIFT